MLKKMPKITRSMHNKLERTTLKICKRCKEEKELGLFYKDIRHTDGLMSYCKNCHNKLLILTRSKKPEKYKEYMKKYNKNYKAPYQAKNPNYRVAISRVSEAIKKGVLKKLPCEICGNKKTYAHHPFYRYLEPLSVRWLCAIHHKQVHKEEKAVISKQATEEIEHKNQQLQRIENSIDFYLIYHKIPEPSKTMIKGNLSEVIKKEFNLI